MVKLKSKSNTSGEEPIILEFRNYYVLTVKINISYYLSKDNYILAINYTDLK